MPWRRTILACSLVAVFAALGLWLLGAPGAPVKSASAASQPRRIASLTLATDEMLLELVPAERIVCVTDLVDDAEISNVSGRYPAQLPRLRDSDLERIIALAPDLVCVAPYNSADFLQALGRSGIAVYRNEAFYTMDQIEKGIVELGNRIGQSESGRELAGRMSAQRQQLAARLQGVARRPGILFWSAGFTSGRATTVDDIIREAGGTNLAAAKGLEGPAEITPEQVIAMDPEFVLVSRWAADQRQNDIENHPLLRELRAVREGRCLAVEGKYLLSVSQYVVGGAERLARLLHPERFADGDAVAPAGAPRQGQK